MSDEGGRRRRRRQADQPSEENAVEQPTQPTQATAEPQAQPEETSRRRRRNKNDGDSSPVTEAPQATTSVPTARKVVHDDAEFVGEDEAELLQSKLRWIPDEAEGFIISEFEKQEGKNLFFRNDQGELKPIDAKLVAPVNPPKLEGVPDMARLTFLNEPSVLHNLKVRYDRNQIYTYSGLFLVAVNPYKQLPIYTPDVVKRYQGRRREDVEPHVFAVSDIAYRQLLQNQKDQSMLVTGESGAGKTENTKFVIKYLTQVAGAGTGGGELEKRLVECNPLLEAFGNAKTLRNNNSSRFGKFIEIDFNAKGYIAGTKIDHYLLETTRVTSQNPEERNFHIFYQITANAEARKKYYLQSAGNYAYLANSRCLVVEGMNDEEEFQHTINAMNTIKMSQAEIENVLTTVASILHLGNVVFTDNHDDCSIVKDKDPCTLACKLLGIDEAKLLDAFQRPLLKVGTQVIQKHVTAKEATSNRDSLVKSMYLRLFEWLVSRVNQSMSTNEKVKNFIGVLDIAGFEIFEHNSFEQLCINFTNEKLQQFFNNHMFKKEQEEYAAERIEWVQQDFGLDLQPTIDLIEGVPSGIFDTLNDVSTFKGATDENFALKVVQVHDKKPVFSRYKFDQLSFVVKHYAGEVIYNTRQWLTKNVDPLNDDCRNVLQKSSIEYFKKMFSQKEDLDARMRSSKTSTVAHKYGLQLKKLMDNLGRTEPHFIRCIKPNTVKKPGIIEAKEVLEQLRCNGVLEGIRISRQGYPGRIKYQDFVKRYSLLVTSRELEEHSSQKAKSEYIMKTKGFIYHKQYQMGLNKVFLKAGIEAKLEEFREQKLSNIVIVAQAALKGAVARKRHRQLLNQVDAAAIVQKNFRAYLRLKDWSWYQLYSKCKPLIAKVLEDRKLKAARQRIEELKKQIQQEIENQKQAEEDKSTLHRDIEKIKADIEISNDKYDRLQNQLDDLEDALENKEREKSIMTNDKQSATQTLQQVRNAINDFNSRIEKKNMELDLLKQKITESELQLSKLTGDGKSKDLEIQKFNKRVQNLTKDLRELRDQLDNDHNETLGQIQMQRNLDLKWKETQAQLEMENKIKSEKEQEIRKVEDDVSKIEKDLSKMRKSGSSLESDIDKSKKEIQEAQDQISAKQKEYEDIHRQKQQADVVKMDTERKLEEETRNRQQAETKNRLLKTELNDAQTKINQVSESNANLEDRISQLKNQIADLTEKLNQLTEQRNALQAKNADLDKIVKDTRFQLEDELSRTKTDLDRANKKYEQALRDFADQIDQANQAKGNLEKKVRTSDNDARALKRQYDDLTRQLADIDAKIRKLEQESNDGDQSKETLRREIAQIDAEKRELESAKKDLESQLEATKEDLNRTQNARKQLQTELDQEKDRLSGLEGEKEALEQAKIANEQKKKRLGDELTNERNNGSLLRSDAQNAQRALEDLQSKLQSLQQQIENASGDNKDLNDRIAQLNMDLENEKNAKMSLEKKKRNLENDIKKLKDELAQELEKLRREQQNKQALEKSLADCENNKDNEKRIGEDLSRQLSALEAELLATKNKLTEADNEYNRMKSEKSDLKRSKEELDEELEDLANQVDLLNKELKESESKFNDERNKGVLISQQKAQAESENNRLKSELDRLRDEVSVDKKQLMNLLDQLKSQFAQQQGDREREIKKLSEDRNEFKNEAKNLRKKIESQPKDPHNTKEYENLKRDYELQLMKLKKQLEEETTARNDAEAKKKLIESQIEDLKNQLSTAEKLKKKVETQKRQLSMEVDELRELAEEADNLREEIVNFKADSDALINSVRSELMNERTRRIQSEEAVSRTKRENEQLKTDLDIERSKVDDQQRRLQQQYESEIEDLNNLLAKAKRDKSSNSRSTKKVDREVRELQRKIQQEVNEREDAQNKLSQVEREVKNLKVRQDQLSSQLSRIDSDKRRAEQTSNQLKQRAFDLEEEISRLRAEADEERNRRSKLTKRAGGLKSGDDDL